MKTARKIDGKAIAEEILTDLKRKVAQLQVPPGLAVILVGDNPASALYVKNKERACQRVGVAFHKYLCNEQCMPGADQAQVLDAITFLNRDPSITAIIVQLPVPAGFDADTLVAAVDPAKDVDGFHPKNIKRFLAGAAVLTPPLIRTIQRLLETAAVSLAGSTVAILGKDSVLRRTLGKVLVDAGAHVRAAVAEEAQFAALVETADVVITAQGKPGAITGNRLKPGAVVIDAGITRLPDGTFAGDVDAASVEKVAAAFTPTPGGVGPLTVAMLLSNVYELAVHTVP